MNEKNKLILQIGNILSVLLTIIINMIAVLLPLNNLTTGEISDIYPNLFVPANITFSIWSIIYLLLGIFAIYQGRDIFKKEKEDLEFLEKISYFFILSSIGNIAWIFAWHYLQIGLSIIFMIIILLSLIIIYLRLDIGKSDAPRGEKLFIHVPISVYLGWITIATIANITALLVSFGVEPFGLFAEIWTILIIIVAMMITSIILYIRKDIAYSLVVIWAAIGIFLKQLTGSIIVATMGLIAFIIVGVLVIATLIVNFIK
ncbi:MAG: hypothetical protein ACFFBP_03170 [Promethearchaeota archaeon]